MRKILFVLTALLFLTGCPKSKLHTQWKDSTLTKKEYLQQSLKRAQDTEFYEKNLVNPLKKAIDPKW